MIKNKNEADDGFLAFERIFMINYSIVAIIIAFFGFIINAILNFPIELLIIPFMGGVAFVGLYFWAKSGKKPFALKIVLTSVSFLIVNYLWFYNFGSHGPAPYFYIIIYTILVFIWRKKQLFFVSFILLANLASIFFIEYSDPNLIGDYPNEISRIQDVYSGLLMYGLLIFVLMYTSKNYLIVEYQKAKKSDKLKSAFLANMSHEIRTPMNAIMGFSQMLDDPNLKEVDKSFYIETITSQGEHLLSLINDIIDISKIESETIALKKENVNLSKLIRDIVSASKNKCNVGVKLRFIENTAEPDIFIITDYTRLQQVITNLVNNALKFTSEGYVEISVNILINSKFCIYVKDTGIGIATEEQDKIFERFYQVENFAKEKMYEGTGIGLAITKAIVNQMGGNMELNSTLQVGSTFKAILPYKPAPFQQKIIPNFAKEIDFPQNKNILIVEDDEMNFIYLKKVIESLKCIPIGAVNGQKAIDYLMANNTIDLILLDMKMPIMDGYETAKIIKKLFPEIPIVAQTAFVLNEDKKNALLSGCNEFLSKPIKISQLRDILKQYLK